jgi:hypothetical protein
MFAAVITKLLEEREQLLFISNRPGNLTQEED